MKKNLNMNAKKIHDLKRMIASSKKFRNIAGGTMIGTLVLLANTLPGYLQNLSAGTPRPVTSSVIVIGSLCLFPFAAKMFNTFCQDINCASRELRNVMASQQQKYK